MKKPIIKIGIDANEANVSMRVGVNTYSYEIIKKIAENENEWCQVAEFTLFLSSDPLPHMPKETRFIKYKVLPSSSMWILKKLTPYLYFKDKFDVFWTPTHYLPPVVGIKKIMSVMDLGYLQFKDQFRKYDYFQLKIWTFLSLMISQRVLSISESTTKDIESHYPYFKNKTVTTLLGCDEEFKNTPSSKEILDVKKRFGIKNDYILFLGTLKPSKNIEGLIKAWKLVENDQTNFDLVIAGKKGWLYDSFFELTKKLGLDNRVIFTDYIEERHKKSLISGSKLFLIPSFWEGFGIDILSAMALGVPVLASRMGSIPEVAGKLGFYCDPYDYKSIASQISNVLNMDKLSYNKLALECKAWASQFSWDNTYKKTISVLIGTEVK